MAGAWNGKRRYLPRVLGERLGVARWESVCHAMVVLWSAEALDLVRMRPATFQTLGGDSDAALQAWWRGAPPRAGVTATVVVLDPAAPAGQPALVSLEEALAAAPRYRGYADAAAALRRRGLG